MSNDSVQLMTNDEAKSRIGQIVRDHKAFLHLQGILDAVVASEANAAELSARVDAAAKAAADADVRLADHLANVDRRIDDANKVADKAIADAQARANNGVERAKVKAEQDLADAVARVEEANAKLSVILSSIVDGEKELASLTDEVKRVESLSTSSQSRLDAINAAIASVAGGIKA